MKKRVKIKYKRKYTHELYTYIQNIYISAIAPREVTKMMQPHTKANNPER